MDETQGGRLMRQIREICELAGIKAEEYAKVTKKRLDVLSLSREMAREKGALGERVYDLSVRADPGDVLEDTTVQAILGRIRNLEAALADCEEEIADIRKVAGARAADLRHPGKADQGPQETPAGELADGEESREEPPRADDDFVGDEEFVTPPTGEESAPGEEPEEAVPETSRKGPTRKTPRE